MRHRHADQLGQGFRDFEAHPVHFVGAPIMHGYAPTTGPANVQRAAADAAPLAASFPRNLTFFVWVAVIGVVIPGFLLGGLKVGGFQFVFKGR